jgi:hypothetical protein
MSDPSSDAAKFAGKSTGKSTGAGAEPAAYLDMPEERRALAKAHAALLAQAAGRVALELPFNADVDDFRRVLAAGASPGTLGTKPGTKP